MEIRDDDLTNFERHGAGALPATSDHGYVDHEGAHIWYATLGAGRSVIMLHGGLGHSGNWGYQFLPALISSGCRVVLIDSRGHGHSTRDEQPYSYELMASDVLTVMDHLQLKKAAFIGWSDGACTALALARNAALRSAGVFFFACKMDPSGLKDIEPSPVLSRCLARHRSDYAQLSATPDQFATFAEAVRRMQRTEPNYSVHDLAEVHVPVAIVQGEHDEFIKLEHTEYLACSIPGAEFMLLPGVNHFAPLQRPEKFNQVMLAFL